LKNKDVYIQLSAFFQEKRDYFRQLMSQTKFTLLNCEGSYFQNVTYEKIANIEDTQFAIKLVKENKVASIPNSAFYTKPNNYKSLRFCFAKRQETLEKAVENLIKL
ncbi:aminotransferase class I/II-fold pyridoxal phosphate-dependent enzyme, partial [Pseudoxanthomonas sp. SGD-10]